MKNTETRHYACILGREYKLSLAELVCVFGREQLREYSEVFAIFELKDEISADIMAQLGGTIRIIEILGKTDETRFPTDVIRFLTEQNTPDTKISFALGSYGAIYRLSDIGLRIKKTLIEKGFSARLVNTKNENINAATFKKERLGKTQNEYNLLIGKEHSLIGKTIACQDIDAYARRDTGKTRDMVVGMMPPKLVQIMINIARDGKEISDDMRVYDPFCGLGTTLIEAANMGFSHISGSDISPAMVKATQKSLDAFVSEERIWQERIKKVGGTPKKDFSQLDTSVFELDARAIATGISKIRKNHTRLLIVSEGYLGDVMSPRDISLDRVQSERRKLASLYREFFTEIAKEKGCDISLVLSIPFWNIHGTYSYFTEIYDILEKSGLRIVSILPSELGLNTAKGSLLYRREHQTVGREILHITTA